jgi:hypothetical protein
MTLEQAILEKVRLLPIEKQQEILNFADSLTQESQTTIDSTIIGGNLPVMGLWKNREDMQNSTGWVHQIRKQEWGQRQRTGADGILHLDIPTGILEGEVEATVTYKELAPQEVDEKGWPIGFLDHFYGICADDPIVLDDEGIAEDLDDDMEGVFD